MCSSDLIAVIGPHSVIRIRDETGIGRIGEQGRIVPLRKTEGRLRLGVQGGYGEKTPLYEYGYICFCLHDRQAIQK